MTGGGDGAVLLWKSNLGGELDITESQGPRGIHTTNIDGESVYDQLYGAENMIQDKLTQKIMGSYTLGVTKEGLNRAMSGIKSGGMNLDRLKVTTNKGSSGEGEVPSSPISPTMVVDENF